MRRLIITFMVLLWGLSPPLLAQFGGGRGDGLDYSDSPQLTLDGVPSGLRPLYGGGPGDGVDQLTASGGAERSYACRRNFWRRTGRRL
jgi:hypothetical protein